MTNLETTMKEISYNYLELLKNLNRVLDISVEILKNKEIDCSKDGESLITEDSINSLDVMIKEECIFAIARFQPAATNLRKLIMVINSSRLIERMGDLLKANLKKVRKIKTESPDMVEYLIEYLFPMVTRVTKIYKTYLTAFENKDVSILYSLIIEDDEVNDMADQFSKKIIEVMEKNPSNIEAGLELILLFKNYERFSDHTIHLVLDLIYILKGDNMRKKELEERKKENN